MFRVRLSFLIYFSICASLAFGCFSSAARAQNLDPTHFRTLAWRQLNSGDGGPCVSAVGVPGDPKTFYVACGPGGLWKTANSGLTWTSIFEAQPVASVSTVAVADSDPKIIFVGTGDGLNDSGASPGNGVYKSADGGATWTLAGLDSVREISKIIIDPSDPNTIFVAALGHIFAPNDARGIFRSRDGGQTWEKVLYKDDTSGAIDVLFDPQNPKTLYAAFAEITRTPWSTASTTTPTSPSTPPPATSAPPVGPSLPPPTPSSPPTPGAALYKSLDAGSTWVQISAHGLPDAPLDRIAITISPADSNRLYALIDADKQSGLYTSADAGDTWQFTNSTLEVTAPVAAKSFAHLTADPKVADSLYLMRDALYHSSDAGASFTRVATLAHRPETFWIDPADPARMIAATSAGPLISTDGGKNWNIGPPPPTSRFNHLAADTRIPYYVYGARLDGTVVALSTNPADATYGAKVEFNIGAPEGFVATDRTNPDLFYAAGRAGRLLRFDRRSAQAQDISPWPDPATGDSIANLKYRFDAVAPLKISAEDPATLYFAAQSLFKTTNSGMSWDAISPDLTRNDKSKQQGIAGSSSDPAYDAYDVISSVAESPAQHNLIWGGTDDGLIHITRDGGTHWVSVTPPDLPPWSRVASIEASWHDGGTAYVAVDAHEIDDLHPYIFRTHKSGAVWKQITTGLPDNSYVHVVREDPEHGGLLFAGTETGVYVSFNDGERWQPLPLNLPVVPVHDLIVKGNDLIAATYGRGFWILEDFSPLRDLERVAHGAAVYLFKPPPALRIPGASFRDLISPPSGDSAPAPLSHGALIQYWLRDPLPEGQSISLEILDSSGATVAAFTSQNPQAAAPSSATSASAAAPSQLPAAVGLNRFTWNMRYQTPATLASAPDSSAPVGALALPGDYKVRLTIASQRLVQPLEIRRDPRSRATDDDLHKQFDLESKITLLAKTARLELQEMQPVEAKLTALQNRLEPPAPPEPPAPVTSPETPPSTPAETAPSTPAEAPTSSSSSPPAAEPSTERSTAPAPSPENPPTSSAPSEAVPASTPTGQSADQAAPHTSATVSPEPSSSSVPPTTDTSATPQSAASAPTPPTPDTSSATPQILVATKSLRLQLRQLEVALLRLSPQASVATSFAPSPSTPSLTARLAYLQLAIDSSDSAPTAQETQLADELQKALNASIEQWQGIQEGDLQDLNEILTTDDMDPIEADSTVEPILPPQPPAAPAAPEAPTTSPDTNNN